jgi:hypothetical protein
MRRGAGVAPPRPQHLGLATLALLAACMLGFASSAAPAGQASAAEVTTVGTTKGPSAGSMTTAPAPDPLPAPKPDPKPARPKQQTRTPPPAPPPALQRSPQRSTVARTQPAPTALTHRTLVTRTTAAAAVTSPPRRSRQNAPPRPRKAQRLPPRSTEASRKRSRPPVEAPARGVIDRAAVPALDVGPPDGPGSGALLIAASLLALGLLALGVAAVSPSRVPWPAIAQPLYAHRSDLAAIGFGLITAAVLAHYIVLF